MPLLEQRFGKLSAQMLHFFVPGKKAYYIFARRCKLAYCCANLPQKVKFRNLNCCRNSLVSVSRGAGICGMGGFTFVSCRSFPVLGRSQHCLRLRQRCLVLKCWKPQTTMGGPQPSLRPPTNQQQFSAHSATRLKLSTDRPGVPLDPWPLCQGKTNGACNKHKYADCHLGFAEVLANTGQPGYPNGFSFTLV